MCVNNLPRIAFVSGYAGIRTRDLLVLGPKMRFGSHKGLHQRPMEGSVWPSLETSLGNGLLTQKQHYYYSCLTIGVPENILLVLPQQEMMSVTDETLWDVYKMQTSAPSTSQITIISIHLKSVLFQRAYTRTTKRRGYPYVFLFLFWL